MEHDATTRSRVLTRLSALSEGSTSSMRTLEFPDALETDAWWMPPELLSLAGTETLERLDEGERKSLARLEAINFFSLNVHGERLLLEGLARRLDLDADVLRSEYMHHMLEEESEHMTTFARFCRLYHGRLYPSRYVRAASPFDGDDLVFFARIVLFEERVDAYNCTIAADPRVHPFVREVHRRHHLDEVRHLAFGRLVVTELVQARLATATREDVERVRDHLAAFVAASAREYASIDVYRDAGLHEPYAIRRSVLASPAFRARTQAALARAFSLFEELGLPLTEDCHV